MNQKKWKNYFIDSFLVDYFSRNGELKFGNHDYEDCKKVIGKWVSVSGLEIGRKTENMSSSVYSVWDKLRTSAKCKQMKTYVRA